MEERSGGGRRQNGKVTLRNAAAVSKVFPFLLTSPHWPQRPDPFLPFRLNGSNKRVRRARRVTPDIHTALPQRASSRLRVDRSAEYRRRCRPTVSLLSANGSFSARHPHFQPARMRGARSRASADILRADACVNAHWEKWRTGGPEPRWYIV